MPQLIVPGATFYSSSDEALFFAWLKSIPGVTRVVGERTDLVVTLRSARLSRRALWDLLALHLRYDLSMKRLAQFERSQNTAWFRDPKMFWHSRIFGKRRV
jgi:hypothetical protein